MNTLGIYFGLEGIQIVNIKKTEILSYTQIPRSAFEISEELGEEKVPQELKIVALIKEELRKAKIEAERLTLVLPGRELILRHFELPPIPQKELPSAISFEVVKYIPFKMNDLIWDYRAEFDKTNKRYLVLFSGIRKDSLDRYLSILNQLNMKILRIEYAGFSILRFLKKEKGISGIIDFDQGDELNFIILKNGFPVFSRDVSFMDKFSNTKDYLDKIKSELRISLDFYHRRFPTSAVHKLFLLAPYEYTEEISNFLKERNISVQISSLKFLKGLKEYSTSLLKAYAGGLR
ncbi:MAG: pilus assembly protein PilM, partial [Candidatus Omnitrophica bacterium]|nr:pilus assembly protein PilM [Candidatus Omnitrophota bacterium]